MSHVETLWVRCRTEDGEDRWLEVWRERGEEAPLYTTRDPVAKDLDAEPTASEALYLFAGELTAKEDELVIGRYRDASPLAEAVAEFIERHGLETPRPGWGTSATVATDPTPPPEDATAAKERAAVLSELWKLMPEDFAASWLTSALKLKIGEPSRHEPPEASALVWRIVLGDPALQKGVDYGERQEAEAESLRRHVLRGARNALAKARCTK